MRGSNFNQNIRRFTSLTSGSEQVSSTVLSPFVRALAPAESGTSQESGISAGIIVGGSMADCADSGITKYRVTKHRIETGRRSQSWVRNAVYRASDSLSRYKTGLLPSSDKSLLEGCASSWKSVSWKSVNVCLNTSLPYLHGRSHEPKNAYQCSPLRGVSDCYSGRQATS